MESHQSTDYQERTMESYPFLTEVWRAQPTYVVDGDSVHLFVDTGFYGYKLLKFRFLDIDTAELRGGTDESKALAQEAKAMVQELLDCFEKTWKVDLKYWPIRIETAKADSFGRWLARLFFLRDGKEVSVNGELMQANLAVPYEK